ncbi:hypothetical protein [Variovorax sp. UMC13]|uniref:hypothetical protein n=1 Tax=Variovorax sp. UMC13 TaxID=1862326 RepID=UPI0015FFE5FD|nr:hypothetical protein [Variovorax sp. UMC13]MBB1599518.1 hypothetical protein [Variovorax sp. UMC13]
MNVVLLRWLLGTLLALLIGASGPLIDGPTEFEAALDTAAAARDVERTDLSERIASKGTP